jgi:DNA-binding winged helix-turn-helix (wHTH) protein
MDGQAMGTREAGSVAQTEPKWLRFDHHVLDLHRGCLLLDGSEIALRPKTFAVLHYLTKNSGRLVSKEELFAAVWPNLAVTDDTLVQSIGELRRALGDDGPRLIRTVPRRGYRLEAAVSVIAPADPAPAVGAPPSAALDGKVRPSWPAIRGRASTLLKTAPLFQRRNLARDGGFVMVCRGRLRGQTRRAVTIFQTKCSEPMT